MITVIFLMGFVSYISFKLFKFAAGTLAVGKINLVSYVYYLCILQVFIGTVLVNLGYNGHYTLNKLTFFQSSTFSATISVCSMILILPTVMIFVFKVMKFDPKIQYEVFLNEPIENDSGENRVIFILICCMGVIQISALIVLLSKIGYIPLIKLFFHEVEFQLDIERQHNAALEIMGIPYIKSIVVLMGIPIISYITSAYALVTREKKWILIAIIYFIASIIVKTYDFSKSPVIFHFFVYLLIYIYYRKGIKNKYLFGFGISMCAVLIVYYRMFGYNGSFLDIYNGILGRTFFTQFGTLCYHFDLFPNIFPYLKGRSLYPTVLKIIGQNPEQHMRSAKIVMEYYGSEHIYEGTGGVMNACFLGEAYANWGWIGVMASIIWVGIVISMLFILMLKIKKNPATLAFCAVLTQNVGNMTQTGFVDFIYNSSIILIVLGFLSIIYLKNIIRLFRSTINRIRLLITH